MAKPSAAIPATFNPYDYCKVVKSRGGKTFPELYNNPATKLLPRGDAEELGWPYYYDGSPCRCGHVSARMTSNSQCCDCHRIKKGLSAIYPTAKDKTYYRPRAEKTTTAAGAPAVTAAAAPLEIDGRDKRILEAYAETRSLSAAAEKLGVSVGSLHARIAANTTFATAVKNLEDRTGIKRVLPPTKGVAWTPEIERRLIDTWIDTGDIATARDSCSVSPSAYWQHIEDSREFAAMVDKAAPLAAMALREKVQQIALAGNPTLLKEFIPDAPKEPEAMPSDEAMVEEIIRILSQVKNQRLQTFIATEFSPPAPATSADPLSEPEAAATAAGSDDDDLDDLI